MVHKKVRMIGIWQQECHNSCNTGNRMAGFQNLWYWWLVRYSGSNKHNLFGTGFMIHKSWKDHMLNFGYLSLKGKFFNVTIICVHVPTEDSNDIVKKFLLWQVRVYHTIPKHDAVMVMGDMNAKVSKDPLTPCAGKQGLHEISNSNRERLCDFVTSRDLVISNIFPHKNIHLQTWISTDRLTANQIDHHD